MKSVLVVEDSPSAYSLIKDYHHSIMRRVTQRRAGLVGAVLACIKKMKFVRVPTAERALEKLRAGYRPDAVVTDQRLNGMKGTDLLEIANSEKLLDGIPKILFTSEAREEYAPLAEKAGAIYKYKGEPKAFEGLIFRLGTEIYKSSTAQGKQASKDRISL